MFIKPFRELGKSDAGEAGGKGASLGEMTRAGIPVPPGFVVLSQAFEYFLEATDLSVEIDTILHTVSTDKMHTVEHASERIQKLILEANMPEEIKSDIQKHFEELGSGYVAVRSSATAEDSASAAWAGQLDSFLNTTEATLLKNVQRCWASLFTPRAIFYRFEQGLHASKISVAVVVQQMVASEVSGIAFSVHPVTEDRNQLIIEAGYGLGEAIVSGQITPDSYVVEKAPRRILDKNIAKQERGIYRASGVANEWQTVQSDKQERQKITDEQILDLSVIIVTIENHYKFPCDIEWAYAEGKFFIVQSRPITTLQSSVTQSKEVVLSKVYAREKSLFYLDVWDQSDRLGVSKYIGGSIEKRSLLVAKPDSLCEVWYDSSRLAELSDLAIAKLNADEGVVDAITSDLKTHWEALRQYFEGSKSINSILEAREYYDQLVGFWSAMNTILFELAGNPAVPERFSKALLDIRDQSQAYTNQMSERFVTFFSKAYPEYAHLARFITLPEAEGLIKTHDAKSLSQLEARLQEGCFLFDQEIRPYPALTTTLKEAQVTLTPAKKVFQKTYERDFTLVLEQSWLESFSDIRERYGFEAEYSPLIALFVTEENLQIWERADSMQAFLDWLLKKNTNEPEFLSNVIDEYQAILKQIEQYWERGATAHSGEFSQYTELLRQGMSLFSLWYYSGVDERTSEIVRQRAISIREEDNFFAGNDAYIRACLEKLGVKSPLANLVLLSELENIPTSTVLEGRKHGILVFDGNTQAHITSLEEFVAIHPDYAFEGIGGEGIDTQEIAGQIAYRGKVQGRVRIVKNKSQLAQIGVGDILVSPMTTPDFVPGMQKAAAFVTDEGGVMCHAAIVAREMQKPCIIGTKIATQVLKDGDLVEVDAEKGVVRVLDKNQNQVAPRAPYGRPTRYEFSWANYQGMMTFEGNITAFKNCRDNPWNGAFNIIEVVRDNRGETYHAIEDNAADRERGRMFLEARQYEDYVSALETAVDQVWKNFERIRHLTLHDCSHEELLDVYSSVQRNYEQVIGFFRHTQVDGMMALTEALGRLVPSETESILLRTPTPDIAEQEAIDWHKLLTQPLSEEVLLEHAYRYPWLVSAHFSYEDVIETLKQKYSFDTQHQKPLTLLDDKKKLREVQARLFDQYPKAKVLVERIQRFAYSRMEVKAAFAGADFYLIPVFTEISRRTGESVRNLNLYYRHEEISQLLKQGTVLSQEIKNKRKHCFVVSLRDGEPVFYQGEEAERVARETLGAVSEAPQGDSCTGLIANKGLYRGTVRILHANDVEGARRVRGAFQKGEILVTEMTQPNILDIASQAGAIVTDEGGMLSHAAIISRELKVPCVVNTRVATKLFQDGDLVEVDANTGLVRIIEPGSRGAGPKAKDYEMTFESQGVNFLLEDIINNSYNPTGVYTYTIDGRKKVYFAKERLEEMRMAGRAMSSELLRQKADDLQMLLDQTLAETETLKQKSELSRADTQHIIEVLKSLCHAYYIFDIGFWDDVFTLAETNETAREKVRLVEKYKNTFREAFEPIVFHQDGYFFVWLKHLERQLGVPERELFLYTYSEVLDLHDGKKVAQSILEAREQVSVYDKAMRGDEKVYFGEEALKQIELFLGESKTDISISELTGIVAHGKGRTVRGEVRLFIRDYQDKSVLKKQLADFSKGAILVAPTTDPTMLPAMRKSVAIVTDIGGLLSHSAITARELDIPCIIGTKIATQVLKDGDLVEVDAEKGIVRKLS